MREENRIPFHIVYHLVAALCLAFIVAFMMLHGYSMGRGLGFWGEIWRTFSYVFPKWYGLIFLAAGILSGFSFGAYGLLLGDRSGLGKALYGIVLLLSFGTFFVMFRGLIGLFVFILVPSIVQCIILFCIEYSMGGSSRTAKPKRKPKDDWED
jgi:hypothetical protein